MCVGVGPSSYQVRVGGHLHESVIFSSHVEPSTTSIGELEVYGAPPLSVVPSEQARLQATSPGHCPLEQVIAEETIAGAEGGCGEDGGAEIGGGGDGGGDGDDGGGGGGGGEGEGGGLGEGGDAGGGEGEGGGSEGDTHPLHSRMSRSCWLNAWRMASSSAACESRRERSAAWRSSMRFSKATSSAAWRSSMRFSMTTSSVDHGSAVASTLSMQKAARIMNMKMPLNSPVGGVQRLGGVGGGRSASCVLEHVGSRHRVPSLLANMNSELWTLPDDG